eukprot:scaffold16355_cov170-Amphora_coffeaeformis.AAC.4
MTTRSRRPRRAVARLGADWQQWSRRVSKHKSSRVSKVCVCEREREGSMPLELFFDERMSGRPWRDLSILSPPSGDE